MRAFVALLCLLGLSGCLAAPADIQKLEVLKEKLRSLHDVLDELNKNIDALEAQEGEKREFAPTPEPVDPEDAELADFIKNLSPEDAELVQKMKSKMKFLQATIHEEPGVDVPAADGYAEEQPEAAEPAAEEKRDMEPELEDMYNHMPEEDQQLLKEHPSMWGHLSKALKTQGGNAADAVAENAAQERRSQENDLVRQLSEDDQELLRRMRAKINGLKGALHAERAVESQVKVGEKLSEGEVRSADLAAGWHEKPAECEGTECESIPPPDAVNEVEKRLLDDVRYAKANGVSLKEVLRVLVDAKRRA